MKIKATVTLGVLVGLLSLGLTAFAAEKVLRLPFVVSQETGLAQGWIYTWNANHKAVDYYHENQQGDWVSFQIVAAFDGELECYAPGSSKYSASLGTTCAVYHSVNGVDFVTLYSHLTSFVPPVDTRVPINAGDVLGMAGKTGSAAGPDIHLHFEVHLGKSICYGCRVDPYDLHVKMGSYPQPYGGQPGLLGANHWWATDPPSGTGGPPNETCNDGVQNQGETGVDCGGPCAPCNNPPQCTNGERRRCWVECAQSYPPECFYGDLTPLIMGIETCAAETWGSCVTDTTCQELADPCTNGNEVFSMYECVDGGLYQGSYTCSQPVGIDCMESFYSNWPVHDCVELCSLGSESCNVLGQTRPCEVYCNEPNSPVVRQGEQPCQTLCNVPVWGQCHTNDACSM